MLRASALIVPAGLVAVAGAAVLLDRPTVAIGIIIFVLVILCLISWEHFEKRSHRPLWRGFPYVLIEPDGTARELTAEERVYVETKFEGGDGAAPYFKPWYSHRNPRGDLGGFLRREQVPLGMKIQPAVGAHA